MNDSPKKTSKQSKPALLSSDVLYRTFLLFVAMMLMGIAFDVGNDQPILAGILGWSTVPILYMRERISRKP